VACPSPTYTGPEEMGIYWDSLYGSFMFAPLDLTSSVVIHKGTVTNAAGKPVAGEPVNLELDGKTYRTYTDYHGNYQFVTAAENVHRLPISGIVTVKGLQQTTPLRSATIAQFRVP